MYDSRNLRDSKGILMGLCYGFVHFNKTQNLKLIQEKGTHLQSNLDGCNSSVVNPPRFDSGLT